MRNRVAYFISRFLVIITASVCISMLIGCMPRNRVTVVEVPMYTFGDANYQKQLEEGHPPVKHGPIASNELPDNFPVKFLEPDGSYAGGRVYKSILEAQRAVIEAKSKGIISEKGEWGIYQLDGQWGEYAYEHRPGQWHLRKSTTVAKRVY